MRDKVIGIPIDHKSGGGFYELRNLRTNHGTCQDIFIMIDGGIAKLDQLLKL